MWGAFLSEPLSIVGSVGRYPADCLMERIPIPIRQKPLLRGAVPEIGPGWIRVTHPSAGRRQKVLLLTAMPRDLHVLSL